MKPILNKILSLFKSAWGPWSVPFEDRNVGFSQVKFHKRTNKMKARTIKIRPENVNDMMCKALVASQFTKDQL